MGFHNREAFALKKEEVAQSESSPKEPSPEELIKLVDQLMDKVSAMRGLKFKEPINKKVSTQEDIREMMMEDLEDPELIEALYGEGKMLFMLGLISGDFDYKKFIVDLYVDQLGGFYVPETRTIHIAAWMPAESQATIFAHELTHALQDQYFDLQSLLESEIGNSDKNMARTSIVEGEATFIMFEYECNQMGGSLSDLPQLSMVQLQELIPYASDSEIMKNAPPILVETLNFPYIYGMDFFMAYLRDYGWENVPALYADLPQSTEQIIHPEKYLSANKDVPIKIDLKDAESVPGKGWKKINTDVLGEFFFKIFLREFTTKGTATIASEGWGGDQVQVLEKGSSLILLLMTAWDTPKDAKEFFDAYTQVIEKKYNNEHIADKGDTHIIWNTERKQTYLGIKNNRVFIIEGATEDSIYNLLNVYWK